MKKLLWKSLYRLVFSYVYAFVGGCMFYVIERKPETNNEIFLRLSRRLHEDFTNKYNVSINESDFQCFMQKAFEVVSVGKKMDWSILAGLSFTMTSLTTIGYGHITPETPLGQIVTVLYCFVGLPISMLTLKTLGEVVSKTIYKIVYLVETKILCRKRPRKVKIKTFFTTFTLMILSICAGGLTQVYLEGWSFVEGVYAWFATLSTIGYGDYFPGLDLVRQALQSSNSRISILIILSASAMPLLGGLCVVSGVLNSLVEAAEEFRIATRCKRKKPTKFKKESEKENFIGGFQKESDDELILNVINSRKRAQSAFF
ncbi:two pore potassium channel protein sup-9-like [Oculina patagonica]